MKRREPAGHHLTNNNSTSMERAPGPRVYVPLNMPDAAVPTYAVLEFVGFSSPAVLHHHSSASSSSLPPSPSSSLALAPPPPPPSAAMVCTSSSLIPNSNFVPFSLNSIDPLAYSARSAAVMPLTAYHHSHHYDSQASFPRPFSSSSRPAADIVHVIDSPPSSPSSTVGGKTASATSSSVSCSRETKEMVIKPHCAAIGAPTSSVSTIIGSQTSLPSPTVSKKGLSAPPSPSTENGVPQQPTISVSQTERGTVVHTHCSNFRDVVRQLTGASRDDQDLLPVTLPARLANRGNNTSSNSMGSNGVLNSTAMGGTGITCNEGVGSKLEPIILSNITPRMETKAAAELGLRKAPLKLHERRKAMRSLEKLSTAYVEMPPLVPSPVTPLASDFEKFCTATTPTASSQGSTVKSPRNSSILISEDCPRGPSPATIAVHDGFYMHPPTRGIEKPGPTLLNLFPESPVCSPRDL